MYGFEEIKNEDVEIAEAIQAEMDRQNSHIELIASENWVSKAVMAAMGSPLDVYKRQEQIRSGSTPAISGAGNVCRPS